MYLRVLLELLNIAVLKVVAPSIEKKYFSVNLKEMLSSLIPHFGLYIVKHADAQLAFEGLCGEKHIVAFVQLLAGLARPQKSIHNLRPHENRYTSER